ncbi:S41 family peptidase [Hymenobacter psychrophilus]|uniref:Peptidase family S41 n=1 Tax=Hymenobacter psychrophilus TaxID=651662 RepID=A0A1H3CZ12_9BACT|nr:S41 family peptidase [Hymenobacter psychrophilus]SDX59473.1 Peptidase family S41 [Hymenobacter psychrophilus]
MTALLLPLLLAGPAAPSPAPPDSLTPRETRNLTALARVVGDLKYFYPNRHTARVSWETVLTRAIPAVRRARTDQALATALVSLLRPLAPKAVFTISPVSAASAAPSAVAAGYFWEHHGLGLDQNGLGLVRSLMRLGGLRYESRIRAASATEVAVAFPAGQPQYTELLTDSVRLTLPLVLTEAQHQQRLRYQPGRRVRRLRANTPAQRLAATILTWNIIRHFYPYRIVLDSAGWADALTVALPRAARATSETELVTATRRMLAHLPDRHINFVPSTRTGLHISPPPYALQLELVDSAVVVRQVPAELRPLVAPGAVLTHLNGQSIGRLLDSMRLIIPATSPAVARQLAAQQLVSKLGATYRAAAFTFQDSAGQSRTYHWTFRQLRGSNYHPLPPVWELAAGIMYLDAARLRYKDFQRALPQLQAARGLVVDLRRRPHYELSRMLPHFSAEPLLSISTATPQLRQPNFRHAVFRFRENTPKTPQLPLLAMPKIFLTGPDTYSYGETVAAMVRNNGLGVLLGQPTGGTNGEMNFATIGRTYKLSFTGRRVRPTGEAYQGRGLAPDILVTPTRQQLAREQDAALQRAVAWLREHL